MQKLEQIVYDLLVERGYGAGDGFKIHYIRQQILKCLEELGEAARHVFDGENPPAEEIADVIIPMAAICAVLGYDLEEIVIRKASKDVERGVRGTVDIL